MADLFALLLDFRDRHPIVVVGVGFAVAFLITGSIETPH